MRMSVHSRPSIQYQDGMELRDRKMTKDCTQPLHTTPEDWKYKSIKWMCGEITDKIYSASLASWEI